MEREYLSSNHFSHENQVKDVLRWLQVKQPDVFKVFVAEFPEWEHIETSQDPENVPDPEWWHWVTDWIEDVTEIRWDDGEPVYGDLPNEEEMDCAE